MSVHLALSIQGGPVATFVFDSRWLLRRNFRFGISHSANLSTSLTPYPLTHLLVNDTSALPTISTPPLPRASYTVKNRQGTKTSHDRPYSPRGQEIGSVITE